ncbi:ATP-binding protein [Myxococcota bacterium]|nr:ATP-binding protein [Myxococcota bacterium]
MAVRHDTETTPERDFPIARIVGSVAVVISAVALGLGLAGWPADAPRWPLWVTALVPLVVLVATAAGTRSRRRGLEALRQSEASLRLMSDNLPDAYVFQYERAADGTPHFTYVSAGIEQVHGVSAASVGRDLGTLLSGIPADHMAAFLAAEAVSAREMSDFDLDVSHSRPDGRPGWYRIHSRPRRTAAGSLVWDGVVLDLTERRAREEREHAATTRHQAQARSLMALTRACAQRPEDAAGLMRDIVRTAAETLGLARGSIWLLDEQGREAICRVMLDRETGEWQEGLRFDRDAFSAYAESLADGDVVAVADALADPRTAPFADVYLRPFGVTACLDVPIYRADAPRGMGGVLCLDHTGGPRPWTSDEETFAIAVANLVSLLIAGEQRARIEDRLRQSQKLEAIGQLAGGVAHDFNNILAAVTLQAEVLATSEGVTPEILTGLGEIRTGVDRAAGLTRQLLAFGRRQTLRVVSLDLAEVVRAMEPMLRRLMGPNVLFDLALGREGERLPVRADRSMMEQVVLNLVVNARDAMTGGGRITVSVAHVPGDPQHAADHTEAAPGPYVRLEVRDSGPGVPAELRARIFEPFFTTKAVGQGTGLGLATVFGVVRQHGGFVEVDDAPGGGARFRVWLPRDRGADAAEDVAVRPGASPPPPPVGPDDGPGVLVVEDEAGVRAVLRTVLSRNGYRVFEAVGADEARRIFAEHGARIQVLLTDQHLPGGEQGTGVAARLLRLDPSLGVVVMSGRGLDPRERPMTAAGPAALLEKPFGPAELLDAVRAARPGGLTPRRGKA